MDLNNVPNTVPNTLPTCARSTIDLNPTYKSQAAMYNEPASPPKQGNLQERLGCQTGGAYTRQRIIKNIAIDLVRSWSAAAALRLARRAGDEHQGCAGCAARLRRAAQQAQPALQGSSLSGRRTMQGKRRQHQLCVCVLSVRSSFGCWLAGSGK